MWPQRDGASAIVHPDAKSGGLKMSIEEAEAGPEEQSDRQKGERGSWSQLSSALIEGLSSQSHVSIGSRVHPITQLSVIKAGGVFLKLFSSPTLAPVPRYGVPAASPDLRMRSAKFSQSLYSHSFFISKTTTKKRMF